MEPILLSNTKRFCYVVTLFGGDGYLPGALVVAHSFHRLGDVNSADLVCLVTNDVSSEAHKILTKFYHYVITVDYLIFDKAVHPSVLKFKPHYAKVWTKFHALRLITYAKVCLIDADYLPYKSMIAVFDNVPPAAVTEVPTGINLNINNFDLSKDKEYSPEWADLFGNCCLSGNVIPGIIFLLLLYSNDLDVELGRYSENATFTGNFYYGGMNASVMLLEPNIHEFRDIINDLKTYDNTHRITFFYPEQQYLTLRYAFGRSLIPSRITEINQEFLNFIEPYFNSFYAKITQFKNILSKKPLSICYTDLSCNIMNKINQRLIHTTDIIHIITTILGFFIVNENKNKEIGPWTSLGLEYFITEYYTKLPPKDKWLGFPILQQKKLWTVEGINLIKENKASIGYVEWFEEFIRLIDTLVKTNPNLYLQTKLFQWIEIVNYYNSLVS